MILVIKISNHRLKEASLGGLIMNRSLWGWGRGRFTQYGIQKERHTGFFMKDTRIDGTIWRSLPQLIETNPDDSRVSNASFVQITAVAFAGVGCRWVSEWVSVFQLYHGVTATCGSKAPVMQYLNGLVLETRFSCWQKKPHNLGKYVIRTLYSELRLRSQG